VPVEAIVGGVELAADEPLGPRYFPLQDFFPRFEPVQLRGRFGPEGLGFLRAALKTLTLFMFADFLNSFGGGKFLLSSSRTSIALSAMLQPPWKLG
jgi:hypothetical protein